MNKALEALKELAKWIYYEHMSCGGLSQYEIENEEETIENIYNTQEEVITIKQALERLEKLEEQAIKMNFSDDERFIHIDGKGIYELQSMKPAKGSSTIKVNNLTMHNFKGGNDE